MKPARIAGLVAFILVCSSVQANDLYDKRKVIESSYPSGHTISVRYETVNGYDIFGTRSKQVIKPDGSFALNEIKFTPGNYTVIAHPDDSDQMRILQILNVQDYLHFYCKSVYFQIENNLHPAYHIQLTTAHSMYTYVFDAITYDILLSRNETVNHNSLATLKVFDLESPFPGNPHPSREPSSWQASYVDPVFKVEHMGVESPIGWFYENEDQTVSTIGNNVTATITLYDGEFWHNLGSVQSDESRVFDYTSNFSEPTLNYLDAICVNTSWSANYFHDEMYSHGFTEIWGNLQEDNFGRGGVEGDSMWVQTFWHPTVTNNATSSASEIDGTPVVVTLYRFDMGEAYADRHSGHSNMVSFHEYAHSMTRRLVGTLNTPQSKAMNEGWSDVISTILTTVEPINSEDVLAEGGWITRNIGGRDYDQNYYFGIRRYPLSDDLTKNPLILSSMDVHQFEIDSDIPINPLGKNNFSVHAIGEIWASTILGQFIGFQQRYEFDEAKSKFLDLLVEAQKLTPSDPTFLDARDAFILADEILFDGEHRVNLWSVFAKRGMGIDAIVSENGYLSPVVDSFDTPNWADYNEDNEVDIADYLEFMNDFIERKFKADLNNNHEVDTQDLSLFFNLWAYSR